MRRKVTKSWVDNGIEYVIIWYAGEAGVYDKDCCGKFASYARLKTIKQFVTNYGKGG